MRYFDLGRSACMVAVLAVLASCGGESGSGGPVVTLPTPTPTPVPTPTPTPTAVTFSVVAVGGAVAVVSFDTNGTGVAGDAGDAASATTLGGEFGRNAGVPADRITGTIPATANVAMLASVIQDPVTGLPFGSMAAPAGATVISPISSLVAAHGDVSAVRASLGLDDGIDAVRSATNVLSFNPAQNLTSGDAAVAQDAARLTSANLQLLVMAILLKNTNGDPEDVGAPLDFSSRYLAELIRDGTGARLTDRAVVLAALRKSAYRNLGETNLGRMADYVSGYFRAMPRLIRTETEARAWMHAFQFKVLADIRAADFLQSHPVMPGEAEIRSAASAFMDAPKPAMTSFYTRTDYRELTGNSIEAQNYRATLDGCLSQYRLPTCNDVIDYSGMEIVDNQPVARITAVNAHDTALLSVLLRADGRVDLARVGTFTGLTWFSYTAQIANGATATGRVYVRVR